MTQKSETRRQVEKALRLFRKHGVQLTTGDTPKDASIAGVICNCFYDLDDALEENIDDAGLQKVAAASAAGFTAKRQHLPKEVLAGIDMLNRAAGLSLDPIAPATAPRHRICQRLRKAKDHAAGRPILSFTDGTDTFYVSGFRDLEEAGKMRISVINSGAGQ